MTGVGIANLHLITVVSISRQIETKTDTYGLLGYALALLLWAYVLGRVFALSAVANASRWFGSNPPRGLAAGGHHTEADDLSDTN